MKPLDHQIIPALCGCDYLRDSDCLPVKRTLKGWEYWAKQEAARRTKQDRFTWHGVVMWVDFREVYRVSFAGQPEKL